MIPGWITSLLSLAATLVAKMWGGGKPAVERDLGRAEQQNADMKADTAIMRRANDAAKKVDQEEGRDPNDRG
jgi:hypothetical protein